MDKEYIELSRLSDDELIKRGLFDYFRILEYNQKFLPIDDWYDGRDVPNKLPVWRDSFFELNGERMDHIMENHTLAGRIDDLLADSYSLGITAKKFDLSLRKIREDIPRKVKAGASLSKVEQEIVADIVRGDKKDYFPRQMSRQQIHKAIREAYVDAKKLSVRQNPTRIDVDTSLLQRSYESVMYSGTGADLTIHFWYNFTDAVIETAYPWYGNKKDSKTAK